jgi:anaerobic magnesium-protoporphyrin IX monomethyl ester cyclase
MNILLVNPPNNRLSLYENNMYPLTLLFLSSYLYKNGYRSTILDLSTSTDPRRELVRYIENRNIDLIGFTGTTENRFLVWDLIIDSKRYLPQVKIVVGGDHFTFTAHETMTHIPEVDIVVHGEGEKTLLEIVKCFENGGNLNNILGISYREDGNIIQNQRRPPEPDIDKLNIDDAVLGDVILPYGNYSPFMLLRNYEEDELKALPIHVGRGCPGKCVYCLYNKMMYRTRSVDSVFQEIKIKKKEYDCNVFHLEDPFLSKRSLFVEEFCNKIINEEIKIKWYAEIKANTNLNLLSLMAKAGCVSVDFALESASADVLKAIRKDIIIGDVNNIIKACKDLGIRAGMFIMISLPNEHNIDAWKTLNYVKAVNNLVKNIYPAVTIIYPGTELEVMAKERGIFATDFSWYDRNYQNDLPDLVYSPVPLWIEHLSPEFITYLCQQYFFLEGLFTKKRWLQLKRILFEWDRESISAKKARVAKLLKYCEVKLKGASFRS